MNDEKICPRCGLLVAEHDLNKAEIEGEPSHVSCAIDEIDENGMDDFHND